MKYSRKDELRAIVFMLSLAIFIVLAVLLVWGWAERQQCLDKAEADGVAARWSLATGCVRNATLTGPNGPAEER